MDEAQARQILGSSVQEEGAVLKSGGRPYFSWRRGREWATLDGMFSADELDALVWWMRNKTDSIRCQEQDPTAGGAT
jgi:hypothetical protein